MSTHQSLQLMPISSEAGWRKLHQYMVICAQLAVPFPARELLEHHSVVLSVFPVMTLHSSCFPKI